MLVAPATYRLLANAHDVPAVIIERATVKSEASLKVMKLMEGRGRELCSSWSLSFAGEGRCRFFEVLAVDAVDRGGVRFEVLKF
jgi:hypothetical protein